MKQIIGILILLSTVIGESSERAKRFPIEFPEQLQEVVISESLLPIRTKRAFRKDFSKVCIELDICNEIEYTVNEYYIDSRVEKHIQRLQALEPDEIAFVVEAGLYTRSEIEGYLSIGEWLDRSEEKKDGVNETRTVEMMCSIAGTDFRIRSEIQHKRIPLSRVEYEEQLSGEVTLLYGLLPWEDYTGEGLSGFDYYNDHHYFFRGENEKGDYISIERIGDEIHVVAKSRGEKIVGICK